MTETKKLNNPNAFPIALKDNSNPFRSDASGMSLRDYFAAKAMQGFIANSLTMQVISDNFPNEGDEYIAEQSYGIADAMLKQREL